MNGKRVQKKTEFMEESEEGERKRMRRNSRIKFTGKEVF